MWVTSVHPEVTCDNRKVDSPSLKIFDRLRTGLALLLTVLMASNAFAQAHAVAPPPPPGAKNVVCKDRTIPQLVDITEKTGIKFQHVADPEKKYIVESMGGGVLVLDYDRDGWPDIYFTNAPTVAMALKGQSSPQRALSQQSRRHVYRRHRQGGSRDAVLRHGRRRGRLQQRRLARHGHHLPRPHHSLPQQRRRHLHRRHQAGGNRRPAVVHRRGLRRLRQRRLCRSDGHPLRGFPAERPAGVRQQPHLQVSRHRRAMRSPRTARRRRLPLSQQRRRHLHRGFKGSRCGRSARLLRTGRDCGPTSTTAAVPTSTSPTTRRRTSSTRTMATASSPRSVSSQAPPSVPTAPSRARWESRSATTTTPGGRRFTSPTLPTNTTFSIATRATTIFATFPTKPESRWRRCRG